MPSQEASIPTGSKLRPLRRVGGFRSLHDPELTAQRDSTKVDKPTIPSALRVPSSRFSQGSMVLDFASSMLQDAAASPAVPHTLQVARQSPSPRPKPQSPQPTSTQSEMDIARQVSMVRRRKSRRADNHRACIVGPRLEMKPMPLRRHTRRLRKPPQNFPKVKANRTGTRRLLNYISCLGRKPEVQQSLPTLSSVDFIDKVTSTSDPEMVRSSALPVHASSSRTGSRPSRAAKDKKELVKSSPQKSKSQGAILLQRAQEDNHGLRLEIIRLQEETARIEARCKRDITRMTARHDAEISRHQENLRMREAQEMDLVSMGIRADFFEGNYKDRIRQLEAALVEERKKSSYHLAHHEHFKMLYEREFQARSSAVVGPVTSPVVPAEDNLWGALQDMQANLDQISSHVEALESRTRTCQNKSEAQVAAVHGMTSIPAMSNEDNIGVARQDIRANFTEEDSPGETREPQHEHYSKSRSTTLAASRRCVDTGTASISTAEANEPSVEPRIADTLRSTPTEKNSNELCLVALHQILPRTFTSHSQSSSSLAGSTGRWSTVAEHSGTAELPGSTPFTTPEPELNTGLTSRYDDYGPDIESRDESEAEDHEQDVANPSKLLDLSISISTIPYSQPTYAANSSLSRSPSPSHTSPILSSNIHRVSIVPAMRHSRTFLSSENGDSASNDYGEGYSGAEMYRRDLDQAVDDRGERKDGGVDDAAKLLLGAWDWDGVPNLDLVDFRRV
ncbi:hypothetical protein ONS95_010990 [Cadophora gregata]|uniref:uncharacterized protein n=1 Tax=Cadophora gregata TaxID=51156 RepID=UPI0026DD3060|nr:uncharacterized protein ONS95_010990 [Cadophora gregata]KAK0119550.1 hypothetical protein ONS95_010990 [Cadophora gregata]KAK0120588.1 hypothetical protein ONS96_010792 [Cadophora gregata f. sp. sojae]